MQNERNKKEKPIVAVTLRHDQMDKLPPPDKSFAARLEKLAELDKAGKLAGVIAALKG